jgi:hypothetical protein
LSASCLRTGRTISASACSYTDKCVHLALAADHLTHLALARKPQALVDFGGRYSELDLLHATHLSCFAQRSGAVFPPKETLRKVLVDQSVIATRRSTQLACYFWRLLLWPNTGDVQMLNILRFPPEAQQALLQFAEQQNAAMQAAAAAGLSVVQPPLPHPPARVPLATDVGNAVGTVVGVTVAGVRLVAHVAYVALTVAGAVIDITHAADRSHRHHHHHDHRRRRR